jgi:hypothetical protein
MMDFVDDIQVRLKLRHNVSSRRGKSIKAQEHEEALWLNSH